MKHTICDGADFEKINKLSKKELLKIIEYAYDEEGARVIPSEHCKYHEIEVEERKSKREDFIPRLWGEKILQSLNTTAFKTE